MKLKSRERLAFLPLSRRELRVLKAPRVMDF